MREGQLRTARARFLLDTVPGQIDNELERRGFELLSATEVLRGLGGEVRWRGAFRVPAAPQSTPEALAFNLGVVYTDMLRLHDVKWGEAHYPSGWGFPGNDPTTLAGQLLDLLLRTWADDLRRGREGQRE